MKKFHIIIYTFIIIVILSSCKKETATDTSLQLEEDFFQYEFGGENIISYDIDENGTLYSVTNKITGYTKYLHKGKEEELANTETYINIVSPNGILMDSYSAPNVNMISLLDDKILYISYSTDGIYLNELLKETKSSEVIGKFTDYTSINKLEPINDTLFFIGRHKDKIQKVYTLASDDRRFHYSGEQIGYFNLSTGTIENLPIELPLSISKNTSGNLVIYAYDPSIGYYFTIYDVDKQSLSDKIPNNMGQLSNFTIFNKENNYIYLDLTTTTFKLSSASLTPEEGKRDVLPDILVSTYNIKSKGEYTYFIDLNLTNIFRFKTSAYLRDNKKLTLLSNQVFNLYVPFSCGYNIKYDATSDDKLALLMLSQDKNYDIYSMNTRQDISSNIRDKGSFYPLNEVDGVKEYLDACFPYIKEAATNLDGDIWMLPIYIDIPIYLYNESICKEYNIDFSNSMNIESFLNIITRVKKENVLKNLYFNSDFLIVNDFIYQYLRENKSFETDLFTDIATLSKDKLNYMTSDEFGNSSLNVQFQTEGSTDFLFQLQDNIKNQMRYLDNTELRATSIPSITNNQKNIATCYFLAVNPKSKNIKESLKYISSLSKYLLSNNKTIMKQDRTLYPNTMVMDDIYQIYASGDIKFTYPSELFLDEFEKYLLDEIDLETVIIESNRRLDIYLKE